MNEKSLNAGLGHNGPPITPYEAIKARSDDLLTEARHWADGTKVETAAHDYAVSQLIEDLRLAEKAADEARKEENKPFDSGKAAVQAKYNVYISPLTNKEPGKLPKAMAALKAALKPYRDKLEADRLAAVEAARVEADRVAPEAAKARAEASESDLEAIEAADLLTAQAEDAAAALKAAEKEKTPGLRKTYTPVITDKRAAMLHYMNDQPDAFVALVQSLAETDVRAGKRTIPGVRVDEGTKL